MAEEIPERSDGGEPRFWRMLEAAALVVYVALSVGYVFVIPPGAGPDEPEHLAYVKSLALNHQLPALPASALSTDPGRITTYQAQHPPTYYVLMTPLYWLTGGHPSRFYVAARLLSVLLGLGGILLVHRAAGLLFLRQPAVIGLTVLFASTFGTYQYVCGTLNNEPMAALIVGLGLYLAARALVAERPLAFMALLGAALGVGLLVKLTTSVLIAAILVVAIRLASRRKGAGARIAEGARLAGVALACAAAVSGWWFARTAVVYGTPMVRAHHRPLAETWSDALECPPLVAAVALGNTEELLRSLWAPRWLLRQSTEIAYFNRLAFGLVGVDVGVGSVAADEVAILAVFIIAAVGLRMAWRGSGARPPLAARQRCIMSVVVGMIVWTILGLQYQTLLVDGSLTLFVGRYAPVVLPPLGLLLAMGLERLIPARVRRGAVVVILAGLLAYNLSVMHAVSVIQ